MTKLAHPFMNSQKLLDVADDEQNKKIDEIADWIKQQPRFPNFSRNHCHQFLHACFWNVANSKKTLQKYAQFRLDSPDLFNNRDVMSAGTQNIFNISEMVSLPGKTPEGYHILCYRLVDSDPSKIHFAEAIKAFCMFNDVRISEDGLTEGYVVVFDMKGIKLGHLGKIQLGPMRRFMTYIQEAHPVRLKKVYVVHTSSFINQIMALIKPFIKTELLSLLYFTTQGPLEIFSDELLPEDYGGKLKSLNTMYIEERKLIENDYRDWLIDSAELRELPKIKNSKDDKKSASKVIETLPSNFNNLEID